MVSSRGCDGPWAKRSLGALQELEAWGIGPIEPEKADVATTFEYQENMNVTAVYEASD